LVSLHQLQEVPSKSMILLAGPPGAGKSEFCEKAILQNLAIYRHIIYLMTECDPSKVEESLKERGLGEIEQGLLNFVDAYSETVGLLVMDRSDTVTADCASLSSIGIAISKLQERIGKKDILLVFDSLTSPYLLNGPEVVRFMRLTLSRFAGEGNSVLVCFDEGCSKEEDLVAMMSLSEGVIKLEKKGSRRMLNVVKHPKVEPTRIEVPRDKIPEKLWDMGMWRQEVMTIALRSMKGESWVQFRTEVGSFVNLFWPNFVRWSNILWDPKRFPKMMYELTKYSEDPSNYDFNMVSIFPWHKRLLIKLFMPKSFSKVKDMKKILESSFKSQHSLLRIATVEYRDDISKTDEHYLRFYEGYECWGLENVDASLGIMKPAMMAGSFKGMEELLGGPERDWNAIETKCIGLGDPYCEVKFVPGEIEDLKDSLEKDSLVIERVNDRLMDHLMEFLLQDKPLMKRPTWGSDVHIHELQHVTASPNVDARLRMVFRMGGARAGKMLGEALLEAALSEQEVVRRMITLLNQCKVGKITLADTIRMKENCERFGMKTGEPSCYFTTGFFNGFFSAVKNQHVKETKCIAMGDPYCEWEFR